jgi:hypothetical protein
MGPFVMNTKREVLQAFEDFQKGLLGTVPAVHIPSSAPKSSLNRGGQGSKLSGDRKDVLSAHNAPTEMQGK